MKHFDNAPIIVYPLSDTKYLLYTQSPALLILLYRKMYETLVVLNDTIRTRHEVAILNVAGTILCHFDDVIKCANAATHTAVQGSPTFWFKRLHY